MSDNATTPPGGFTTSAKDQAEAAKLKARLKEANTRSRPEIADTADLHSRRRVPIVSMAEGAHKYALISARDPVNDRMCHFVTSKRGAHYHRNAAEPVVYELEQSGYNDIQILGGGRISLDNDAKKISIFGFSYSFGQADHALSKRLVEKDDRYRDWEVTISNEGY